MTLKIMMVLINLLRLTLTYVLMMFGHGGKIAWPTVPNRKKQYLQYNLNTYWVYRHFTHLNNNGFVGGQESPLGQHLLVIHRAIIKEEISLGGKWHHVS